MTPNDCVGKCPCHTTSNHLGKANNMVAPISDDGWLDAIDALIFWESPEQEKAVKELINALVIIEAEKRGREML